MSFPKIRVFINSDENLKSGGIPAEKVPPALYDMMLVCKSCNATINNEQIITTRHDGDAFDGANRPVLGTKSSISSSLSSSLSPSPSSPYSLQVWTAFTGLMGCLANSTAICLFLKSRKVLMMMTTVMVMVM